MGWVGLGNMGGHMATNLLKGGYKLVVYDMSASAVERLAKAGAQPAKSAEEVAQKARVVFTMLPSSPHVAEVYRKALFRSVGRGGLLVDCSTIDPNVTKELAREGTEHGLTVVDAPVSGGVGGAEAGTLTFMVGGSPASFEAVKPFLQKMGKNIVHCGDAGTGQVAKICNNLVLGISMAAVAEAMNLGVRLGADPKVLAGIINTSAGRCWSSDTYNPVPGVMDKVPSSRNYEGGFGAALMRKDLGLAAQAALAAGAELPTGLAALNAYTALVNKGYANKDFSSLYDFLAKKQ